VQSVTMDGKSRKSAFDEQKQGPRERKLSWKEVGNVAIAGRRIRLSGGGDSGERQAERSRASNDGRKDNVLREKGEKFVNQFLAMHQQGTL
jgi:hypothetical protein